MPPLDFGPIELPDLTDTDLYPVVDHAPACVDAQPFDNKSCHVTPLIKIRPYAFTTEPLGRLKQPRPLHPLLPPVPPTHGTHCPTITQEIDIDTAVAAEATTDVTLKNGDACRPTLIQHIKIPCTNIVATVSSGPGFPSGLAVSAPTTDTADKKCTAGLSFTAVFPTAGGTGFTVGTTAPGGTNSPFIANCCAAAILPGAEVPTVDTAGVLGAANTQLNAATHEIINASKEPMVQGDVISLEQAAVQTGGRIKWKAYLA